MSDIMKEIEKQERTGNAKRMIAIIILILVVCVTLFYVIEEKKKERQAELTEIAELSKERIVRSLDFDGVSYTSVEVTDVRKSPGNSKDTTYWAKYFVDVKIVVSNKQVNDDFLEDCKFDEDAFLYTTNITKSIKVENCVVFNENGKKLHEGKADIILERTRNYRTKTIGTEEKAMLHTLAETAIKNKLKAPSTAKFHFYDLLDNPTTYGISGDEYYITSYVDAQNSFGVYLKQKFTVYAKSEGLRWYVTRTIFPAD